MRRVAALTIALCLALPAAAQADDFTDVYKEYQRTGTIDPCKFTPKQLKTAKRLVPNDIEQYAPDFPAALDEAQARRAKAGCATGSTTTGTAAPAAPGTTTPGATPGAAPGTTTAAAAPATPPGQTPQPTPDPKVAPAAADQAIQGAAKNAAVDTGADDTPAPLALLAILGGLLLLGALLFAAARWWAWEPGWLVRGRHASQEAGWRASAMWAEFTDWVRLGR